MKKNTSNDRSQTIDKTMAKPAGVVKKIQENHMILNGASTEA